MKYYNIVELTVTDPAWVPEYMDKVTKMVEKRGGRFLARTEEVEGIEGTVKPGTLLVVIEWPSKEAALETYGSEEYKPFLDARLAGSDGRLLMVAGKDDTGQAAHC